MVAGYRPVLIGAAMALSMSPAFALAPLTRAEELEPLSVEPKRPEPAPEPAVAKETPIREEFVVTAYDCAADMLAKSKRERKNARRAALRNAGQADA